MSHSFLFVNIFFYHFTFPGLPFILIIIICINLLFRDVLLQLEECTHPTVMKDMCAECGADLRQDDEATLQNASIPMVHCIPELKVSKEVGFIHYFVIKRRVIDEATSLD